ncbi:MAG: right-handed parallel beta-helix repeat-containing protein [Phycisphaerales bacterium]
MNRTAILCTAIGSLSLLAAAALLTAGPLDPPAGPVTPTYKTLSEVEPRVAINLTNTPGDSDSIFKITQPGSYYLTGSITAVPGKHGIEIAASGVTIDLNGFDLVGIQGMGPFDGVSATVAGLSNLTVTNGSVRNWGDEGVDLGSVSVTNARVAGVLASGNSGAGISVSTRGSVLDCAASLNADGGILTNSSCAVINCTASGNTGSGVSVADGSTVANCSTNSNSINGIRAFGFGCTITGCSAFANAASGISANQEGCTISGCSVNSNGGTGIIAGGGSTVWNCSAFASVGSGISIGNAGTVVDCSCFGNRLDGIVCVVGCTIRGNTCMTNGLLSGNGAGIHSTGPDNRIEGNNCTDADRGIDVDAAGNMIIGNTCSGNTINWDIIANNVFGPIIDRTAPGSATVSGNSAPDSTGTTHPHANFTY